MTGYLTERINTLKLMYYSEFCTILSSADTEIIIIIIISSSFFFTYLIALLFSEHLGYIKFVPTQKIGSTIYG
jgi:hypothetical protein